MLGIDSPTCGVIWPKINVIENLSGIDDLYCQATNDELDAEVQQSSMKFVRVDQALLPIYAPGTD